MINASKEFKEKLKNGANLVNYADITLSDGTVLNLTYKDFMIGGCQIEDKTTDGKFGVGFCIGKTLSIRLENHDERFSKYDFYNSIINLYAAMQLDDGSIEKIRKGVYYTILPETPGDIIEISAVDGMYKLDRDYSASSTIYPSSLQTIISDVCLDCGIPIGFTQFDNMSYTVAEKPENATYRQVLSWACQIAGYNAHIDNNGYMQLVWYNTALLEQYNYTGGNFKTYPHDTIVDGGNFTDYSTDTIISGGNFTDPMPEHIFRIKSLIVSTDDVQITGVRVISDEENTALFGEEGYLIEITENPFVSGKEQAVANYLGARMVGMVFRPFSAEILNNPLYEPFDVVRVSDRNGNVYLSILNSISYTIGAFTQVACEAEDPVRNGSTYVSAAAQAVVEARRNTQKQISAYDKTVQQMNELAANAMGLFREEEKQENGSIISYESDRPITIDEDGKCHFQSGSHVWKKSDSGFFSSGDGGETFTAGFDANNNAVLNVLYAIGIVADWIRSGKIEITKDGQTMVLMDFDTKQVILRPDVFELSSGQTIDSIAQEKANSALESAENYADDAICLYDTDLTQQKVFNKLTNNGEIQGIYLQDGKLYINGSYMKIGKISSKNGKVYFDLDNNEIHCDKLVSTETYGAIQKTVADITRRSIGGNNYSYGLQIYNRDYEEQRITIDPGRDSIPKISTGTSDGLFGLVISARANNGTTSGSDVSQLRLDNDGIITLKPPPGNTGLNAEILMYPGYYGNVVNGYNSKVIINGYTVDINSTNVAISNALTVGGVVTKGTKSRLSETKNYGNRLLYCYEMPSPMFGDIGEGETDESGECYIDIGDIFSETIANKIEYQVFLQKEGQGDIWIAEKHPSYFVVKGTENLKFAWEIKAKQMGFEYENLDYYEDRPDEQLGIDYESEYIEEMRRLILEQEVLLNETA